MVEKEGNIPEKVSLGQFCQIIQLVSIIVAQNSVRARGTRKGSSLTYSKSLSHCYFSLRQGTLPAVTRLSSPWKTGTDHSQQVTPPAGLLTTTTGNFTSDAKTLPTVTRLISAGKTSEDRGQQVTPPVGLLRAPRGTVASPCQWHQQGTQPTDCSCSRPSTRQQGEAVAPTPPSQQSLRQHGEQWQLSSSIRLLPKLDKPYTGRRKRPIPIYKTSVTASQPAPPRRSSFKPYHLLDLIYLSVVPNIHCKTRSFQDHSQPGSSESLSVVSFILSCMCHL